MADQQPTVVIIDPAGTRHVFPPGFDPMRAAAIVRGGTDAQPPAAPAQPESVVTQALRDNPGLPLPIRAGQAILRTVVQHPVASGAMAGGALASAATGGLALLPAAALSGLATAGGAGYGLLAKGAATGDYGTPSDNAQTVASEGVGGVLGEGVGRGAAKLLTAGGKLVYKAALRPSMALQRDFGDIAQAGLDAALPVNEAGAKAAEAAKLASSNDAKQMIAQAAPTAQPVRVVTEVGKEVQPIVARASLRASTGLPDESPAIVNRIRAMAQQNPGGIDLNTAQEMKGELQDLAARVYRAQGNGAPIVDLGADTNAAMASGLRKAVEARVPGVADANATTQSMMGAQHAIENATMRNVPGVGSVRTLLGDFAPSIASRLAILANNTGVSGYVPPTLKAALVAALSGAGGK